MLVKDVILNSSIESISSGITHLLPGWGFPIYFICLIGRIKTTPCSILMKDPLSGEIYSRDNILASEKGISLPDKDLPSF